MGPKNLDPDLLSIIVMHILTEINVNLVLFNNPLWSLVFTICSWEKKDRFFCDKSDFGILQELCISFKA